MRKISVCWRLEPRAKDIINKVARRSGRTVSSIINYLILTHLQDPVKVLEDDNRELAKKIHANQEQIEYILSKRGAGTCATSDAVREE